MVGGGPTEPESEGASVRGRHIQVSREQLRQVPQSVPVKGEGQPGKNLNPLVAKMRGKGIGSRVQAWA